MIAPESAAAVNKPSGRPADESTINWTETRAVLRVMLIALSALAVLWLIYQLGTIILLLVFSILFAYLVEPLVTFVRRRFAPSPRRQLPIGVAIGIVYLFIAGGLALSLAWLMPLLSGQVAQFAKDAPQRFQAAQASGQRLSTLYGRLQLPGVLTPLIERGVATATSAIDTGVRETGTAFVHLAGFLPWVVLIPILAFFLIKDAAAFRQGALALVPPGRWKAGGELLVARIDAALAAFIRAQLVACLIVGVLVGLGFALLRVPYAASLAIIGGLSEFIPLVGPFVFAIVSAVIAALHTPMLALWVLIFLGVLRVVEDYVIYPRLVGRNIHLHPMAVILGVLAGAELGGVVGVLLSVPALAILSELLRFLLRESRASGISGA
jgi:predicted PurR-regulated permease PerM